MTKLLIVVVALGLAAPAAAEPPFRDLPWIWPQILTSSDPSTLREVTSHGWATREFEGPWTRPSGMPRVSVWLFNAAYRGGHTVELWVHQEYNRRRGRTGEDIWWEDTTYNGPAYDEKTLAERRATEAEYIASMVGRLPAVMRSRIRTITLDTGYGNMWANRERREIRFHTRFNDKLESYGAGEEYLIHEAGHLLENEFATKPCWRAAQRSDGEFISEYAASDPGGTADDPGGEDFAETLVAYFAIRYRPGRLSPGTERTIKRTIPARIRCLDRLGLGSERPQ